MGPERGGAIVAAYGLGAPTSDLAAAARGEQGRMWKLRTERGDYAVKELFVEQIEVDAAADVDYQAAVLEADHVPMPRPVRTVDGCVLTQIGDDLIRVYEWVDVLPPRLDLDPEVVGATVAAIHRVHHEPARPVDPWYTDPVGGERWFDLSRQISATGAPFAEAVAAEVATLVALEQLLAPPEQLQNCHRDLWADNVLPTSSGGVCVIDWENCGLAEPGQELAMVLFEFGYHDPARRRVLCEAYVDVGGSGRLHGRRSFSMVIAVFGHIYEMAAEEWLAPDATEETRNHSISRFDELLDRPLTIDVIDEILDSVS